MPSEFTFEDKRYRVARRGTQWMISGGDVVGAGPSLVDAMEAVFGGLHHPALTRIAIQIASDDAAVPDVPPEDDGAKGI